MKNSLFIISIFFFLSTCTNEKEQFLVGKWQATKLMEADQILDVPVEEVFFTFNENKIYTFNSTLNYKEAGKYEQSGNILYTTDTLQKDAKRKAVKILTLDETSLKLEMEDEDRKLILDLTKK